MSNRPTSLSLLDRLRAQENAAWQRFASLYSPLVYAWCRRQGVMPQDAADILQEVFQAVHRKLPDFHPQGEQGSFRAWLWTITRNKLNDWFRRRAVKEQAVGGTAALMRLSDLPDREPLPERHGSADPKLLPGLALVQAEFETRTWQAFWMSTVQQRPTAEVAIELEMTPGAVRKAKFRVLRRLRDELGELL